MSGPDKPKVEDVLFWLKYRGSQFGEGRQVVSEGLLDAAANEIKHLRDLLSGWVELGDRTLKDSITQLDANLSADFSQGIRETKNILKG